jgi:class 3 adenylate cyclase
MMLLTVYALFGDDMRLAMAKPSADDVFYGVSALALLCFFLELTFNTYSKADYVWGFYFWLDVIATLSLIPDVGWIWDAIMGTGGGSGSGAQDSALKAGRASRAGTRAGRVVRIVRLVRLVRIVKLYKHVQDTEEVEEPQPAGPVEEPSAVGKCLLDLTTRRVIVLVLTMLLLLPLLAVDTWVEPMSGYEVAINNVHQRSFAYMDGAISELAMRSAVRDLSEVGTILRLQVADLDQDLVDAWVEEEAGIDAVSVNYIGDNYRTTEAPAFVGSGCFGDSGVPIHETSCANESSVIWFDVKSDIQLEAWLSFGKTLLVMIALATGAIMFTRDAERLVIGPIERMVDIVKKLSQNPLGAIVSSGGSGSGEPGEDGLETAMLERTLTKIGGLLQIGFGEAGAEIIAKNLKSGAFNPMIEGKKMFAIFGFCDIRQFTDATECLQEKVMVFVNRIGEIVHFATHQYAGSANKNIGDAFLLVWRLPGSLEPTSGPSPAARVPRVHLESIGARADDFPMAGSDFGTSSDVEDAPIVPVTGGAAGASSESAAPPASGPALQRDDSVIHLADKWNIENLCDNALYAFLKIVVDIENSNRNGVLGEYANHPAIKQRFPDGYKVRMGFGLHVGWAIEGAIGSTFKIDASYLSPHVNMSARLEAATKQFGVPLLLSHMFVDRLSPAARAFCRAIDCVTVKGSKQPMTLYTFDVTDIPPEFGVNDASKMGDCVADFAADARVPELQQSIAAGFFTAFREGFDGYRDGDWTSAKAALERAEHLKPGDGPTATLRAYMSSREWTAPSDWPGYRELTEK